MIGAAGVAFFLLEAEKLKVVQPAHGLPPEVALTLRDIPCRPGGTSAVERVVHQDETFWGRPGVAAEDDGGHWLRALGGGSVLAVPWRVGERVMGAVAAYGSKSPAGFTREDEAVVRLAAFTAGLLLRQLEQSGRRLEAKSEEAEQIRSTAEHYAELESLKRRVLNLAAHELRGPVTILRGYLSMIAEGSLEPSMLRRVLPILLAKAAHMDLLITQMLEAARLDEGRLELQLGPVDLGGVARQTVDVAALLAPSGLAVFLDVVAEPVLVNGDRERLGTVVANLVDNGMKYSPDGGVVRVSVGRERGRAYVRVKDTGVGIDPADMPTLFTRFGRIVTPANSHIGGTGLGLHLSQELARLHGGEITATSTLGAGSEFTLWLPLSPTPD